MSRTRAQSMASHPAGKGRITDTTSQARACADTSREIMAALAPRS